MVVCITVSHDVDNGGGPPSLHWGCGREGRGWKPPPPGWQTSPPKSYDAGVTGQLLLHGDNFEPLQLCDQLCILLQEVVPGRLSLSRSHLLMEPEPGHSSCSCHTRALFCKILPSPALFWTVHYPPVMLSLMLWASIPCSQGGLVFVLKTADGRWLQDQAKKRDFFFSLSDEETKKGGIRLTKDTTGNIVTAPGMPNVLKGVSAPTKVHLTQEERNLMELPDITKGVPWLPNQAPLILPTEPQLAWDTAEATAMSSKWSIPTALMGTIDESDVKVGYKSLG